MVPPPFLLASGSLGGWNDIGTQFCHLQLTHLCLKMITVPKVEKYAQSLKGSPQGDEKLFPALPFPACLSSLIEPWKIGKTCVGWQGALRWRNSVRSCCLFHTYLNCSSEVPANALPKFLFISTLTSCSPGKRWWPRAGLVHIPAAENNPKVTKRVP